MNQIHGQAGHVQQSRILTQEEQLALLQAQLEAQLSRLVEQNKDAFTDLQRRGINFDPLSLLGARIDSLISSIAGAFGPQGQVWAVQVRLDWETAVAEQLQAAGQQGTKAQLAVGGQFTPAMIRQLAKETGTLGSL